MFVGLGGIHTHEDAARLAALLGLLTGLLALFAWRRLVRYPREVRMPGSLRSALLVTSLAAAISIGYASWLGERMGHDAPALPEPASALPQSTPALPQPASALPQPEGVIPRDRVDRPCRPGSVADKSRTRSRRIRPRTTTCDS